MTDWIDHERARAALPPREDIGQLRVGITGHFCAAHRMPDDVLGQGKWHGHSYEVEAWFSTDGRSDARCFKAALETMLKLWDHGELPPDLQWCEHIARAVGTLANCVEVTVWRRGEGLHGRWIAPMTAGARA